jgi:hypothetical protein
LNKKPCFFDDFSKLTAFQKKDFIIRVMIKSFITVKNGIITGRHESASEEIDFFGTPYYGHEAIEVPAAASIATGDPVDFYSDWVRRSDGELVDAGLMTAPVGYFRNGNEFTKMTEDERIINGVDPPRRGTKVEDGAIVEATLDEQLSMQQITKDEYKQEKLRESERKLNRSLAALGTEEAKARAEIDEAYAAERKAKLTALLAVKTQKGWPLNVEWPE